MSIFFVTFKKIHCSGSRNIIKIESKNVVHLVPSPSARAHTHSNTQRGSQQRTNSIIVIYTVALFAFKKPAFLVLELCYNRH